MPARRPPPLRLERSLLYAFAVIGYRVTSRIYAHCRSRYGMSPAGWRVLAHVGEVQPVTAKAVCRRAAMDSVSLSRAITHLAELGFVDRRIDPDDRRRIVLSLTRQGQAAYDHLAPMTVAAERALLSTLAPAERRALFALRQRVREHAAELDGGASPEHVDG